MIATVRLSKQRSVSICNLFIRKNLVIYFYKYTGARPITPEEMRWCLARFGTPGWRAAVEQIVRDRRYIFYKNIWCTPHASNQNVESQIHAAQPSNIHARLSTFVAAVMSLVTCSETVTEPRYFSSSPTSVECVAVRTPSPSSLKS